MTSEGGESDVALAGGSEADTWCTDNVGSVEQGLEELPGTHAVWTAHPDVGSILAAVALIAEGAQGVEHLLGVLHVIVDGGLNLLLALWRIDGLGGTLRYIAAAIELGTLATQPELVERYALALEGADGHLFRHDGITAADTCETCRLGIGTELDGAFAGTANLEDGVGYLRVLDVGLIGGIVEDEGIVLQCVVHPLAQLLLGDNRTRGVVRIAEVDDIDGTTFRKVRNKTVLSIGGHIAHVGPATIFIDAAAAYHHVGVDIDGIDGVGHTDEVLADPKSVV